MDIPKDVIEKIKQLLAPAIVAISGFAGSGKSTAAHMWGDLLRAPVVCIDHFGIDRIIENYTYWNGMAFGRLEKEVLIPFLQGENPVIYGHGTNYVVKAVEVSHNGLLIIEGVGLFRLELLKYFAYKIWIDCPQEIARERGKKRDQERRGNQRDPEWDAKWNGPWKRNDEEYFSTYKPKEQADVRTPDMLPRIIVRKLQILGSETENLMRKSVPGKMVSVLFSVSQTKAIALERWVELNGESFTCNSFSVCSIEAELRSAV
jgi:uridine kinase